jgi:hypothetical protein
MREIRSAGGAVLHPDEARLLIDGRSAGLGVARSKSCALSRASPASW